MSDQPENMYFEKMKYKDLHASLTEGDTIELLRVMGVATMHRLFMDSEVTTFDRLVYVVTPEAGPYDFIVNRFPNDERDMSCWRLPTGMDNLAEMDRISLAVQHWVVDQAHQELRDER